MILWLYRIGMTCRGKKRKLVIEYGMWGQKFLIKQEGKL